MKRELIRADGDEQAYAQVIKMLGNGRLTAQCFDGKERLCHIRGKLRKKVWINTGDIILVGLRGYQEGKADVILKYTTDEARILKNDGQLPESARLNENDEPNEGEIEFVDFNDELSDNEVGAQDRMYDITSSEESESDEESDEDDAAHQKKTLAATTKKLEHQSLNQKSKWQKEESSSEESDSEADEEEDPELMAERGTYKKPGGKDKYGKATKGKRGK